MAAGEIRPPAVCLFFFNDPATTEIYTLSLHDALPIYRRGRTCRSVEHRWQHAPLRRAGRSEEHTSELQSHVNLVCRLLLEKKTELAQILGPPLWRSGNQLAQREEPGGRISEHDAELDRVNFLAHPPIFFFNDEATTEIYTLSLHDALPI